MTDRISKYPGRVLVTPEDGSAPFYAVVTRADEPEVEGTPLNKETFLNDDTLAVYGLDDTATPNDVLEMLPEFIRAREDVYIEFLESITVNKTLTNSTGTVATSAITSSKFREYSGEVISIIRDTEKIE